MSERIEWNIEECRQVAIQLNQQGTLIKNALAGIYNTFRYKISGVWSGKNYNKVVEYVNGFAPDFKSMTEYLGVTVPEAIKEIVNAQAQNGGISDSFSLASDSSNPDIWTVELSNVSADGAIKIDMESVNSYILGAQYPSVKAALDLALQYFNNYVNVLEQNLGSFNNNDAIMVAYDTIQNYKSKFENDTRNMVDTIVDAANQEISGIEDVDLKTQHEAEKVTDHDNPGRYDGNGSGGSKSGNGDSSGRYDGNGSGGSKSGYEDSKSGDSSGRYDGNGSGGSKSGYEDSKSGDSSGRYDGNGSGGSPSPKYKEPAGGTTTTPPSETQAPGGTTTGPSETSPAPSGTSEPRETTTTPAPDPNETTTTPDEITGRGRQR